MENGVQPFTAAAMPKDIDREPDDRRRSLERDLLSASREPFKPEPPAGSVKQTPSALGSSTNMSFKQVALHLAKVKNAEALSWDALLNPATDSVALEEEPSASLRAQRRRLSLMSVSASTNVAGSWGVMKKRQSLPTDDSFRLVEQIPRERRGGAADGGEQPQAASERPASSTMSSRRKAELSEHEAMLPGARARALSARTRVSLDLKEDIWTKAFKIDYAPLSFQDIKRKRSKSEPVTATATAPPPAWGSDGFLRAAEVPRVAKVRQRPWNERPPAVASTNGRVEVHYESYLPKQQWLQVKPKKFVFNHRHGTSFEKRSLATPRKVENVQEVTIWENPYRILLFEKAAKDSDAS